MPVTITIKQVGSPDKVILGQQEKKALPTSPSDVPNTTAPAFPVKSIAETKTVAVSPKIDSKAVFAKDKADNLTGATKKEIAESAAEAKTSTTK